MRVAPLRMPANRIAASTTPSGWDLAQQRDGDGVETVTDGKPKLVTVIQADHFDGSCHTRQRAGNRHAEHDHP